MNLVVMRRVLRGGELVVNGVRYYSARLAGYMNVGLIVVVHPDGSAVAQPLHGGDVVLERTALLEWTA